MLMGFRTSEDAPVLRDEYFSICHSLSVNVPYCKNISVPTISYLYKVGLELTFVILGGCTYILLTRGGLGWGEASRP